MVEQNDRADVDQPLHTVADARGHNVLGADDGARFERGLAAAHRRTDMVDEVDSADSAVDGLGIAKISVDDVDIRIRRQLRRGTPQQDADDITSFTETAQQGAAQQAARAGDQHAAAWRRLEPARARAVRGVGLLAWLCWIQNTMRRPSSAGTGGASPLASAS